MTDYEFARLDLTAQGRQPTIRDVARRAGVAPSTVSAVLNGTTGASSATRLRVQRAAEELSYQPNSNARNLKKGTAQSIGLMVPELSNAFFAMMAEGVERAARAHDYTVVLCSTHLEGKLEADYVRLFRTSRLDGVIVNSGVGRRSLPFLRLADSCPIVVVDQRVPGLAAPFVGTDNHGGARSAARPVIALGHKRIGIVTGPAGLWTAEQRLAGYREELAAAGFDVDRVPVASGDFLLEGGMRAAAELLSAPPERRPTALLVANDLMAVGCMRYCVTAGLSAPRDVSVVGFDDIPLASAWVPALTTVSQRPAEIGEAAAALLLAQLDGAADPSQEDRIFPTELVMRQTLTAPGEGMSHHQGDIGPATTTGANA